MRRRLFGSPRRAILPLLAVALGFAAWGLLSGCRQGRAPFEVIPSSGSPSGFLPPAPGGLVPGTTLEKGELYWFDDRFLLFPPISGTDPRYIKRDSVLAVREASVPGAPLDMIIHPDRYDTTLARVYAHPRLFGFARSVPGRPAGFTPGVRDTVATASAYFPMQVGNSWESNHNSRDWTIVTTIANVVPADSLPPTAPPGTIRMRATSTTLPINREKYQPAEYSYDVYCSSNAGPDVGIFFHAWTLISERDVPPNLRGGSLDDRQRNPRFLWLSIESLDSSRDPQASPPVATDQCLDGLPAHCDLFPVKLCGNSLQEGDIWTTWTYLEVPAEVLRQRLNTEAERPRGGRCGVDVVVGQDTLRMFPTGTFRLLAKYEVRTERIVDQVELKIGTETIGRYPRDPSPQSVVKFVVTMSLDLSGNLIPVQYFELWYQKDIGEVIRNMGVNPISRSKARLRLCTVNNEFFPPDNPLFFYHD